MATGTIRVTGLREFQSKLKKADSSLSKDVKAELKKLGDIVTDDAQTRGSRYQGIGAYKPIVQQKAVLVRQSANKVTGLRGDFGALQMRNVLEPALAANEDEVESGFERMLDMLISRSGL